MTIQASRLGSPHQTRQPTLCPARGWLPLFLFTVFFGLSMDYHVFILSRVKELVDRGVPTDEAVARGDWNWYLPRWLEWLPRLNVESELHEEVPESPAVPVA